MSRQALATSPLRVLEIHNHYQQPGGEDQVFAAETRLLELHGDEVIRYTAHNDRIRDLTPLAAAKKTFWNRDTYRDVRRLIRDRKPDVMHAHNTFPLISPAAYAAAREEGVPVVQTVHNFRLLCANGLLFRAGRVCEDCVGKRVPWPAVLHRCYRGSVGASAVVAGMLVHHRAIGTWQHDVDLFVALTEFARLKLIEGGLPAARIVVKPNFVDWEADPDPFGRTGPGDYLLYAGRLSAEKGIRTLVEAWTGTDGMPPLWIAGDGPLRDEVLRAAEENRSIRWLGHLPRPDVQRLMRGARALILPSVCYEAFPLVVLEAYSLGVPMIASRAGALESIVEDGKTGLLFAPADPLDLRAKAGWVWSRPDVASDLGRNARSLYLERYTGAVNYHLLRAVYALAGSAGRGPRRGRPAPGAVSRTEAP
jgi:glycosyltransferase involved in cell wall biosynthesis